MKILKATEKYEGWLRKQTRLVNADVELKHQRMAMDTFQFLRATFYRWVQLWPEICPELARAPRVLAVGDLHVENFGTWRDVEGRLIWGVNDFDETHPMAYTNDLVRLAVSAHLAIEANHLALRWEDACKAIVDGYTEALKAGGQPFVLEEQHHWLRVAATGELRRPPEFWAKMSALPTLRGEVPRSARKALESLLPAKGLRYRVAHRVAGLGSLGRQRYVALAEFEGGMVAREAKALLPSACVWAEGGKGSKKILYECVLTSAIRALDPYVHLRGKWIVRRLAPHCSRIELSSLPSGRDEARLLHAMGFETANVHLGSGRSVKPVLKHLKALKAGWLHNATQEMLKALKRDWDDWRRAASGK